MAEAVAGAAVREPAIEEEEEEEPLLRQVQIRIATTIAKMTGTAPKATPAPFEEDELWVSSQPLAVVWLSCMHVPTHI